MMENKLEILKSVSLRLKYIGYVTKHKNNHEPFRKITEIPSGFYRNRFKQSSSSSITYKSTESSQIHREKEDLNGSKIEILGLHNFSKKREREWNSLFLFHCNEIFVHELHNVFPE